MTDLTDLDGSVGLIRIAYDFSVWPRDGEDTQNIGSRNVFSSASACGGSTCIPWHPATTGEEVVNAVVSHVLYSVAKTAASPKGRGGDNDFSATSLPDPTIAPKLRKEWNRVLRLALVVDNGTKGSRSYNPTTASMFNNQQPSSLVLINQSLPLVQQPTVIQSLHTSGTVRTLDTAIIVVPYDDTEDRTVAVHEEIEDKKKKKQMLSEASKEELKKRFIIQQSHQKSYREQSDKLRKNFSVATGIFLGSSNSSNSGSLQDTLNDLATLEEKKKQLSEEVEIETKQTKTQEGEYRREVSKLEQDLLRFDTRIADLKESKTDIEEAMENLQHMSSRH